MFAPRPPRSHVRLADFHSPEERGARRENRTRPFRGSPSLSGSLPCGAGYRPSHPPRSTIYPLNAYTLARPGGPLLYVQSADLTRRIRANLAVYPDPSYHPTDVSARSNRAGGAMALLCAGVDRDHFRMIGRWRSDELFRYLHVQAQPIMNGIAASTHPG
jgi:hypothetical protein